MNPEEQNQQPTPQNVVHVVRPIEPEKLVVSPERQQKHEESRRLYPDLNLWECAQPILEKWLRTRLGPRGMLRQLRQQAPVWSQKLLALPDLVHGNLLLQRANLLLKTPERRRTRLRYFLLGLCTAVIAFSVGVLLEWFL